MSVVLPTYDYAEFVAEAIESVLTQTIGDLELIVVDDGSTDRTPELLAGIVDPRLTTIRTENRGVSAARNEGLERSRGNFVAFMDADDRWHPRKLEWQLELLAEPGIDLGFSDFVRFDRRGTFPRSQFSFVPELQRLPSRRSRTGSGWVVEVDPFLALTKSSQLPVWPSTLLLPGDLARSFTFPDARGTLSEDLWYILAVASSARRMAYSELPLAALRRHGGNSYGTPLEKLEADLAVLCSLERVADSVGLSPRHREAVSRRIGRGWCSLGYTHLCEDRWLRAGKAYGRALLRPGSRADALMHLAALPVSPLVHPGRSTDERFDDPDDRLPFPWHPSGEFHEAWTSPRDRGPRPTGD